MAMVIYAKLPWSICLTASLSDECHIETHFQLVLVASGPLAKVRSESNGPLGKKDLVMFSSSRAEATFDGNL